MQSTSQRMEVQEEDKTRERDVEIVKIMKIFDIILDELGSEIKTKVTSEMASYIIDIDLSDEISGFLMTVFTCLRKEENDPTGFDRYRSYIATIQGVQISVQSVIDKVKAQRVELNFLIATPIVELMTLFKGFFDEVRTGVTRFRVRASVARKPMKRDARGELRQQESRDNTQSISQYGLVNHHIPLLQGITLAPERRTGVIRSLGPMTQAILLTMEDKYHSKLSNALLNSIQMLPMANEVIVCLKDAKSPGQVQGILKELGDILLISTARSTQKVYFPLLLIAGMWRDHHGRFKWSFSGAPMLKFYNKLVSDGLKFRIKTGSDILRTSEVLFHAMFGTYLDDLSLLSQITTHSKWHQRKDLNSVFHKRSSQKISLITPIKFKYVSKMAQSLLTKCLGNVDPMATSRPSFSGMRKRTFTQEFLSYLQTGKSSYNFSNDPMQLQFSLKKLKDSLLEEKDSIKVLQSGTTAWEEERNEGWAPCDFVPVEGNIKFYGSG